MTFRPNSDVVVEAWLRGVPGIPTDKIGATLPTDNASWSASGFVQYAVVGGAPGIHVPLRAPVVQIDAWACPSSNASNKPPWWKANHLAELLLADMYTDQDADAGARNVTPELQAAHPQYDGARVLSVYALTEPRRINDDPSSYARYTFDVIFDWVRVI